jgi:hypothetical protein
MTKLLPAAVLGLATAAVLAGARPAEAATAFAPVLPSLAPEHDMTVQDHRDREWRERRYYGGRTYESAYDGPVWRGRDGRYYCRRNDGTTGLLIGGAVGGLIGHGIAGNGDRTLGTILGVAGGALLGREIDRSGSHCR